MDKLIEAAKKYRENAYAPYSKFKVGAAVLGQNKKIYGGCNIENVSFSLTVCAERAAIFKAVSEGVKKIEKIAVVTSDINLSVPCGACIQVILEFAEKAKVYCCDNKGNYKEYEIKDLMPFFNKKNIFTDKLKESGKDNPK
ncbi:MAG: cytidine deaminase [Elusimicrobiota bacterium]